MSLGQFGLPFTVYKSRIRYYLWSKYYACESYLEDDLHSVLVYVTAYLFEKYFQRFAYAYTVYSISGEKLELRNCRGDCARDLTNFVGRHCGDNFFIGK